jgi:hypothetical protein
MLRKRKKSDRFFLGVIVREKQVVVSFSFLMLGMACSSASVKESPECWSWSVLLVIMMILSMGNL